MKYEMEEGKLKEVKPEEITLVKDRQILEARQRLSQAVREVWGEKELIPVRDNLEKVGEVISEPYEKIAETTGYGEKLQEKASELGLRRLMKSAWGKRR